MSGLDETDLLAGVVREAGSHRVARKAISRVKALTLLIAGERGRTMTAPEPLLSVGFNKTMEKCQGLLAVAMANDCDVIHLIFDRNTPDIPTDMWVVHRDGDLSRVHSRSFLWLPPDAQTATILASYGEDNEPVRFMLREGQRMEKVAGWPTHDVREGVSRAHDAWDRLTAMEDVGSSSSEEVKASWAGRSFIATAPSASGGPEDNDGADDAGSAASDGGAIEGDNDAWEDEQVRRMICAQHPAIASVMNAYAAALTLAVAGKPQTIRPEPLIQAGFEPFDEEERKALVEAAIRADRDLVQFNFSPTEPNAPTGALIIYREEGGARMYSRHALYRPEGSPALIGFASQIPEPCTFLFCQGERLGRLHGYPDDVEAGAKRAYAIWDGINASIEKLCTVDAPLRRFVRADDAGELQPGIGDPPT